jgi:hypothetical protein
MCGPLRPDKAGRGRGWEARQGCKSYRALGRAANSGFLTSVPELADFQKKKRVLIAFYPKDFTGG